LRVRNRILDVLRFGTLMAGNYESTISVKNNIRLGDWLEQLRS